VFRGLKEANLRRNPKKCLKTADLGHRVPSEGIGIDPEKVATIAELEQLGVASWYRRIVPDFFTIVKPLNVLLRKGSKWKWTPDGV